MASFCAAARDASIPTADKRRMFFNAVNTFTDTMTKVLRGHGFKAHMHALTSMVKDHEELPALFQDKAWNDTKVASVKTVKTDCLEGAMLQETAFLLPEPKCIFLHYEVEDDGYVIECLLLTSRQLWLTAVSFISSKFFVQAWPGRTRCICDALDGAAQIVRAILENGQV